MRESLLLLLSLVLFTCSSGDPSDAPAGSADIRIKVTGTQPGKVVLVGQFMNQQFQADTAHVNEAGEVTFRQPEPYETGYYFAFFPDQTTVPLLLDRDQQFSLTTTASDVSGEMEVDGSDDNELLYEGLNFEARIGPALRTLMTPSGASSAEDVEAERQRDALIAERQAFYEKIFADHPQSFYTAFQRAALNPGIEDIRLPDGGPDKAAQVSAYKKDFWNDVDFTDPRLLRTPAVDEKLNRYFDELTVQQADSVNAAADRLLALAEGRPEFYQALAQGITLRFRPGQSKLKDAEAVFVHMVRNYFTRDKAVWLDSMTVFGLQNQAGTMEASLIGRKGADLTVPGTDGRPRRLYDLKTPYVIVFIYNPDCDHCIEETPKLLEWTRAHRDKVSVYAIALSTEDERWKTFVKEFGVQSWTNVHDPSDQAIFRTYYTDSTPELYVLGPDRTIIAKNVTTEDLDQIIP